MRLALALLLFIMSTTSALAESKEWWSLQPIPPKTDVPGNAIDHFVQAKLREQGLTLAPEAKPGALLRRLCFDLTGLPPSPEEVSAFLSEVEKRGLDQAYADLVEKLLASPRYGERWARHWLDVAHYGDTHGYDKDQPRPNAWPYRDYVIRAFNEDKPYARFVKEQIAGDVLFPGERDGIEALGFISAGPWDLIGHAEVPETKIDGKVARHLDRDDMVANTIGAFCSMTVHCAQCHDHKFDPIPTEDYYRLQAVFAAVDRADRAYDADPAVAKERAARRADLAKARAAVDELTKLALPRAGEAVAALDKLIAAAKEPAKEPAERHGYHSAIEPKQDVVKWAQVDLGRSVSLSEVTLHPCHDDFGGIGDGFGFPIRFKVELSDDADFAKDVRVIADRTFEDFANPKINKVSFPTTGAGRYARVTATKLAARVNDYIFALSELEALDATGANLAAGRPVTSLDSIEAPTRWRRINLTDGWYPGADPSRAKAQSMDLAKLEEARSLAIESALGKEDAQSWRKARRGLMEMEAALKALPAEAKVYCGTVHAGGGAFTGTGANGGRPRPIHILSRGDVRHPGAEVGPGALSALKALPNRFDLPEDAPEGRRRAALAAWIADQRNPLTWRSIVNRVWQYHFGRGLVDTPNDFGKMGATPSHPELLDWLAADLRDAGGSFKRLHRMIVSSAVYRQASSATNSKAAQMDPENRLLWRMNRRKLEAEAARDGILAVSGLLDLKMGGPAFQDFVVRHPEHSPHYEYHLADLADPNLHRRSVYRFLVRSKPQPWMATMDCADPSMMVDKRTQTITPLQALAQLNNQLTLVAARKFAERVAERRDVEGQVKLAIQLAFARDGTAAEIGQMRKVAEKFGMKEVCRAILNANEFLFVD